MISWRCISIIKSILNSLVFFDILSIMIYPCMLKMHIICPCHMHCITPIQGVYIHQQYSKELSELKGGQDLSFVLLDNALFANNPKWHFKLGCYTTNFFLLNENKLSICSRPVKSNRLSARRLAGLFELKFYVLCVDANQRIKSKVFL